MGEGELENYAPLSQFGRGAGGEGKTHAVSRFQLKLIPMHIYAPLQPINGITGCTH